MDKSFFWEKLGCYTIAVLAALFIGGWSVNYILINLFDKAIPFGYAMIAGLFLSQFTFPIAIIVWVLKLAGLI